MINSQDFSERLKLIFDYYDLTASSFADQIDVGRASISHILSGRNKPSLDFVMKVVSKFEDVELYWLLNGKGSFPPQPMDEDTLEKSSAIDMSNSEPKEEESPASQSPSASDFINSVSDGKKIQKVIIFYEDGSFEAYQNCD